MNEPTVLLNGLTKRYGHVTAVEGLDLTVPTGQILALLGPNGAGKSTAVEMILGITRPDAGSVSVLGADPTTAVRRGDIGAMLQNGTLLWDTTVGALVKLMHGLHCHPLPLDTVVDRAGLGPMWNLNTNKLSGGQAQRVRFALAILPNSRLLLLDEPTVGMDVDARRHFWGTMADLTQAGRTVVFATHYLEEADGFADRIVVLNRGAIVADGSGRDIKRHVGGRRVSFTGPDRDWSSLPGVLATSRDNGRVTLTSLDSDQTLRALIAGGEAVADVEVFSPSLEDAFLTLVNG